MKTDTLVWTPAGIFTNEEERRRRGQMDKFWAKVEKSDGCWTWTGAMRPNGYGQFMFDGYPWKAHRMAWTLTNGKIPAGKVIAHACDNRRCVRPDHLRAWTQAENLQDMHRKGRYKPDPSWWKPRRGETHPSTHLTQSDVDYIRANYKRYQHPGLHHKFGVSKVAIHCIVNNKTWRAA